MSLLRHREIYRNAGKLAGGLATAPSDPHCDEFPASYSLASCSPAELASASPALRSMIGSISVGNDLPANGNPSLVSVSQWRGALQSVTFEESMDSLKERHEALTESVEMLAIETRELKAAIAQDAENIRALARIAEIHERRITRLEDSQQ